MNRSERKKFAHRLVAGLIRDRMADGWPFDQLSEGIVGDHEDQLFLSSAILAIADEQARKGGID
jgi:hypothetical protein